MKESGGRRLAEAIILTQEQDHQKKKETKKKHRIFESTYLHDHNIQNATMKIRIRHFLQSTCSQQGIKKIKIKIINKFQDSKGKLTSGESSHR